MKQKIKKRATSAIPIMVYEKEDVLELLDELLKVINKTEWPYTSEFKDLFLMRDKALEALLILSGLRISEALALKLDQVKEQPKRYLLLGVKTLKNGFVRQRIVIPKDGSLGRICVFFTAWYEHLKKQPNATYLFPSGSGYGINFRSSLSRYRAHRIIKTTSDKFPHWFRAVYENIYGHIIFDNNPYKLKDCMGLKTLEATVPYIQANYENDIPKVYMV